MRRVSSVLFLIFSMISLANGQEHDQQTKRRVVIVPSDVVLAVIASQPDSPLEFEMAQTVRYVDGESGEIYRLRNRGSKPIRAYSIAVWTTTGGGDVVSEDRAGGPTELLMPGQIVPQSTEEKGLEFVALTTELRDKLKLRGPLQTVMVFMVVRVDFEDGTPFNDEPTLKAMQTYFQSTWSGSERKKAGR
jgi:hypothetical protein